MNTELNKTNAHNILKESKYSNWSRYLNSSPKHSPERNILDMGSNSKELNLNELEDTDEKSSDLEGGNRVQNKIDKIRK